MSNNEKYPEILPADLDEDQNGVIAAEDEGDLPIESENKKVLMEPKDITIFQYKRWFDQGRLNLNPDWQRSYVWRGKRPSLFIESLLMKLPIPVIFLARNEKENYEVIDGVQRLTTAFNFADNKFSLSNLSVFREFNGKYFKDLPTESQSAIDDSTITAFILSEHTSQDMLFTIFERINTGGMSLNEMEIRNCIFRGRLNDKIRELTKNKDFLAAVNMKNISERMLDRGLILRFLAFYEQGYDKASNGLKSFLNRFFEIHRNASDARLKEFDEKFRAAMRSVVTVFGTHAFRLRKEDHRGGGEWGTRVNASIFQVITTSFARYDYNQILKNSDAILEAYLSVLSDQRWVDAVTKSTGDYQSVKYAFETWYRLIDEIVKSTDTLDKTRVFNRTFKEEIIERDNTCAICGQKIAAINDSAIDHVEQYWLGGKTIPSNARLVHRQCNAKRPRSS